MDFDELYKRLFLNENGTYRAVCANRRVDKDVICEIEQIRYYNYNDGIKILKRALEKIKSDKENKVIPEIYRKAMFFVTCKLCDEAGTKGAQKKVLNDLNLSHNTFSKYKMTPVQYFEGIEFNRIKNKNMTKKNKDEVCPQLCISRNGKKNIDLCRAFVEISSQVHYTDFVDVFGGLGTITARKPKVSKEYTNDFDNGVYKFLIVLKQHPKLLIRWQERVIEDIRKKGDEEKQIEYAKFLFKTFEVLLDNCNSSLSIMNSLRVIYNKVSAIKKCNVEYDENDYYNDLTKLKYISQIYQSFLDEKENVSFLKYICKNISENDNYAISKFEEYLNKFVNFVNNLFADPAGKNVLYADGFFYELFAENLTVKGNGSECGYYKELENREREAKVKFESLIDIAGAFYFINSFIINGKSSDSGINSKSLKKFEDKLENINSYSERFSDVTILHQDFRDVIMSFNSKSTLLYLDSPYIDTQGYNVSFEDQEFYDMVDLLHEFQGKWIFSCRCSFKKYRYKAELAKEVEGEKRFLAKLGRLASFLSSFRFRGYYVAVIELGEGADGYSDVELMITNFEFIHKNAKKFDELYIEYVSEYDLY